MTSRKAREKLQQSHCRESRAKNRVENVALEFVPEKLSISMSSLRRTHFPSSFLSSLEATKDILKLSTCISWVSLSRLI